jgi:fused signal recognition particle receptor
MFSKIKAAWTSLQGVFIRPFQALFNRNKIDANVLEELRQLCINADMGIATTERIIKSVEFRSSKEASLDLKSTMRLVLLDILSKAQKTRPRVEDVIMIVGINGSGKTTTVAKLAVVAQAEGKKVLLVAADTFRAAAVEQLQAWAMQFNITCIAGKPEQDPAAVIFGACVAWKSGNYNHMIIDTAGRVQTKLHLMEELSKMRRVLSKQLPKAHVTTLLTVDSTLGQNSLEQVRLFQEAISLDGIILTKCDGSGKGGIIFAVADQLNTPVRFITVGERASDIMSFDAEAFVDVLLSD